MLFIIRIEWYWNKIRCGFILVFMLHTWINVFGDLTIVTFCFIKKCWFDNDGPILLTNPYVHEFYAYKDFIWKKCQYITWSFVIIYTLYIISIFYRNRCKSIKFAACNCDMHFCENRQHLRLFGNHLIHLIVLVYNDTCIYNLTHRDRQKLRALCTLTEKRMNNHVCCRRLYFAKIKCNTLNKACFCNTVIMTVLILLLLNTIAGVAQRLCNGLPRDGPGFDSRWKRCKKSSSTSFARDSIRGAVSQWARCR